MQHFTFDRNLNRLDFSAFLCSSSNTTSQGSCKAHVELTLIMSPQVAARSMSAESKIAG